MNVLRAELVSNGMLAPRGSSESHEMPSPCSLHVLRIIDAPLFSASTRVSIRLAAPQRAPSSSASVVPLIDVDGAPTIEAIQDDGSLCSSPQFTGLYVSVAQATKDLTAVVEVEVIDRRTRRSVGVAGHLTIPLYARRGRFIRRILRGSFKDRWQRKGEGRMQPTERLRSPSATDGLQLPLWAVEYAVDWGSEVPFTLRKDARPSRDGDDEWAPCRVVSFVKHNDVEARMCSDRAQSDRRGATGMYSVRPIDLNLSRRLSATIFNATRDERSNDENIPDIGFCPYNEDRGAAVQIHGVDNVEPLPVDGDDDRGGVTGGGSPPPSSTDASDGPRRAKPFTVPAPSLGSLFFLRIALYASTGVRIGATSEQLWGSSVQSPRFPSAGSTFLINAASITEPNTGAEDGSGQRIAFAEAAPRAVVCIARVFAVAPKYSAIPQRSMVVRKATQPKETAKSGTGASLMHRFGFDSFDPAQTAHWVVVPYAWGVIEVVPPSQPFIATAQAKTILLFPGIVPSRVLQEVQKYTATGDPQGRPLERLVRDSAASLGVSPITSKLIVSVADASALLSMKLSQPTAEISDVSWDALPSNSMLRMLLAGSERTPQQVDRVIDAVFQDI
jgi:hypothetical protein